MHVQADGYSGRPCYGELAAILLAGLAHVLIEVGFTLRVARAYNAGVSTAFLAYFVWRARQTPGALRVWGLRRDNFVSALCAHLPFVAAGVLALLAFAAATDSLDLPGTFWLTLALYPVWGIAQQFALQNLIARNLAGLILSPLGLAAASAALFAASHYPRLELVALTFVAGIVFTLIYRRVPNLWAVGLAHGLLGSLAVHIMLNEDPGAAILAFLFDDRH